MEKNIFTAAGNLLMLYYYDFLAKYTYLQ